MGPLFLLEPTAAWITRWEPAPPPSPAPRRPWRRRPAPSAEGTEGATEGKLSLRGNKRLLPRKIFTHPRPLAVSAGNILDAAAHVMAGGAPETTLPGADHRALRWMVDFTSPSVVRLTCAYPFSETRKTGLADVTGGKRPEIHAEWEIRSVPVAVSFAPGMRGASAETGA